MQGLRDLRWPYVGHDVTVRPRGMLMPAPRSIRSRGHDGDELEDRGDVIVHSPSTQHDHARGVGSLHRESDHAIDLSADRGHAAQGAAEPVAGTPSDVEPVLNEAGQGSEEESFPGTQLADRTPQLGVRRAHLDPSPCGRRHRNLPRDGFHGVAVASEGVAVQARAIDLQGSELSTRGNGGVEDEGAGLVEVERCRAPGRWFGEVHDGYLRLSLIHILRAHETDSYL